MCELESDGNGLIRNSRWSSSKRSLLKVDSFLRLLDSENDAKRRNESNALVESQCLER
jgi:hypothetical protein